MTERTHWKKLNNPEYIGAYAFQPGEEIMATISTVGREAVIGPDGRKEECTVVRFREDIKPLILNVTNAKMIQRVLKTPYVEEWAGRAIVMGVETVSAFGERVEAVRVKKKTPASPVATLCADCSQPVKNTDKFTSLQIIQAGMSRYGKAVCMDCADKRRVEAAPGVEVQDAAE